MVLWKWKVPELAIDARVELIPIESSEYLKITCVSITNRFYFAAAILKWLPIICETKSVHYSLFHQSWIIIDPLLWIAICTLGNFDAKYPSITENHISRESLVLSPATTILSTLESFGVLQSNKITFILTLLSSRISLLNNISAHENNFH